MCVIFLESMDSNIPRVKNRRYDISNLKLLYTVYAGWSRETCLLVQGEGTSTEAKVAPRSVSLCVC